jgi:CRP/FNR family transcriptional regulator, dissimilatory nitrate respiration regulator
VNNMVEQIGMIPLFQGLPSEQLRDLAGIVVTRTYRRGDPIFLEGEEATGLYVAASGRVKIFKLSSDGKEQILHIFGAGEPFGEVAVFSGRRFPANAEALEETQVLRFPRSAFVALIQKEPSLALNMLAVLCLRLRQFAHLIENLSLKEVPGRLAAYLLYESDQRGQNQELELDIAKGQLASLLGTIPETLSRILAKMSGQGLIQVNGPHIRIMDRQGLEDLAEWGKFAI